MDGRAVLSTLTARPPSRRQGGPAANYADRVPPEPSRRRPDAAALATVALVVLLVGAVAAVLLVQRHRPLSTASGAPPAPAATTSPSVAPLPPTLQPLPSPGPGRHRHHGPRGGQQTCATRTVHVPFTVVTFNIKSAIYGGRSRLPDLTAELAAWHPDVVLLEEVDRNRVWSGRVDEAAYLGARLGLTPTFAANVVRSGDREYGTAVLSRFPVLSQQNTALPNRPGLQQRGLLHVRVAIGGRPVSLYVTHLDNTSRSMRVVQMGAVRDIVAADPLPRILGGDMNDVPGSPVLARLGGVLTDTWSVAGSGPGLTAPAGRPRVRIDYLLYGDPADAGARITPLDVEVAPRSSSDHRAARARYDLAFTGVARCSDR